jgi:hypothetical protein
MEESKEMRELQTGGGGIRILELCSGTASFSRVCQDRGHETLTVDVKGGRSTAITADLFGFIPRLHLPPKFRPPDIIAASPPCTFFSLASSHLNWRKIPSPGCYRWTAINDKTRRAIHLVQRTLKIIEDLDPPYWFIENPVGMLRHVPFMEPYPRFTVTYCQYAPPHLIGEISRKATDFWTNDKLAAAWTPRPPCKPGSLCHSGERPKGTRGCGGRSPWTYAWKS